MRLRDYAAGWLCRQAGRVAPTTYRAYSGALRRVILPRFGACALAAISTPEIRRWLMDRLAAGAARATVTGELAALSGLLTDAMLDGLVAHNAAHGAARRLWPTRHAEPKALTREQLERLVDAAGLDRVSWVGAWCRIGARTGLRPGEQLALTEKSLDAAAGALRVDSTYHGTGIYGPPKGGRTRIVEVSPATMALLIERASLGFPVLFPGRRRDWPLDPASLDRAFGRAVRRAGLPAYFTPHALRHSYASLLVSMGAPLAYVRQQMGHSSIRMTIDTYGSGIPASRPDLVGLLDTAGEPQRHPPRSARHGNVLAFTRSHPRRA